MQRVMVAGISGAGKTTLARRIAARSGLPYFEMDALFHGPGWSERAEFAADVGRLVAGDRWVTDSIGYPAVQDLLWQRADTLVWLDYSRRVVMPRVLRRSIARALLRTPLWHGNRETVRSLLIDPGHPVRWAWHKHGERRAWIADRVAQAAFAHLTVVRLSSPRAARQWLRGA